MGAQLRVVLDQLSTVVVPDEAEAARELTAALIDTAPRGCTVAAIVPAGDTPDIAGLSDIRVLRGARKDLATAWSMGMVRGVGGGLIHAPTLMAPLVKHDRVYANDQTVVTLWDLCAWDTPEQLSKAAVAWHRAMLRRAVKHADAVVVPSHPMAERLAGLAALGDRIRVIAGAAPASFFERSDAAAHRSALDLPADYVVLTGSADALVPALRAAARADVAAVILDSRDDEDAALQEAAQIAGLAAERLRRFGWLDVGQRAAALGGARAYYAGGTGRVWPWRVVEAMTVGVPVVAAASDVHQDVIADGGVLTAESDVDDALLAAMGSDAARLRVLAEDRSRAFSWHSAAERVWSLHADL